MADVYHERDRSVVIYSHELHPPVMPRKYNNYHVGVVAKGWQGGGGKKAVLSNVNYLNITGSFTPTPPPPQIILIHSPPQTPRSFWSAPRITTSG